MGKGELFEKKFPFPHTPNPSKTLSITHKDAHLSRKNDTYAFLLTNIDKSICYFLAIQRQFVRLRISNSLPLAILYPKRWENGFEEKRFSTKSFLPNLLFILFDKMYVFDAS